MSTWVGADVEWITVTRGVIDYDVIYADITADCNTVDANESLHSLRTRLIELGYHGATDIEPD